MLFCQTVTFARFADGTAVRPRGETPLRYVRQHRFILFSERRREIPRDHGLEVIFLRRDRGDSCKVFFSERSPEVVPHQIQDPEAAGIDVR